MLFRSIQNYDEQGLICTLRELVPTFKTPEEVNAKCVANARQQGEEDSFKDGLAITMAM